MHGHIIPRWRGGVVSDGKRRLPTASSFIICLITGGGVSGNRRQAGEPEGARERTRTEMYSHKIPQAISVTSSPSAKTQLNFKMICKHPFALLFAILATSHASIVPIPQRALLPRHLSLSYTILLLYILVYTYVPT